MAERTSLFGPKQRSELRGLNQKFCSSFAGPLRTSPLVCGKNIRNVGRVFTRVPIFLSASSFVNRSFVIFLLTKNFLNVTLRIVALQQVH